jgi:hypothetical protein
MMTLFIVLWLLNADQDIQRNFSGYFRRPKGFGKQMKGFFLPGTALL